VLEFVMEGFSPEKVCHESMLTEGRPRAGWVGTTSGRRSF
jgi:hypothetical protein